MTNPLEIADFTGFRILVVEDEFLVALEIEQMMLDLGCTVIGPIADLDEALAAASTMAIDGAVLDVNVGGRKIDPVADALAERGIPFILSTGYTSGGLSRGLRARPRLNKPFGDVQIAELMAEVFRVK